MSRCRLAPLLCLWLGLPLWLGACERRVEEAEPTEPWQKRPTAPAATATRRVVAYQVAHDGELAVSLPAREATPLGKLRELGGAFSVDLDAIEKTRGTVTVDLGAFVVLGDDGTVDPERTETAQRWLGLGAEVAPGTRRELAAARLEIESLDEPSATRVSFDKATPGEGGRTLAVRAVAVSRLVVRNLAVAHRVPIELVFSFAAAAGPSAPPARIVARLRGPWGVPLAEHDVTPRDATAQPRPSDLPLLGRVVGKTARISGEIALVPRPL